MFVNEDLVLFSHIPGVFEICFLVVIHPILFDVGRVSPHRGSRAVEAATTARDGVRLSGHCGKSETALRFIGSDTSDTSRSKTSLLMDTEAKAFEFRITPLFTSKT